MGNLIFNAKDNDAVEHKTCPMPKYVPDVAYDIRDIHTNAVKEKDCRFPVYGDIWECNCGKLWKYDKKYFTGAKWRKHNKPL